MSTAPAEINGLFITWPGVAVDAFGRGVAIKSLEALRDAGAETEARSPTPWRVDGTTGGRDPLGGSGNGAGAMLLGAAAGVGIAAGVRDDASADLSEIIAGWAEPWGKPWDTVSLPSGKIGNGLPLACSMV